MDDVALTPGKGPGQMEVTGSSQIRVTWHFSPVTAPATHLFVLTYRARGAVEQQQDADVLWWRMLPEKHAYRIRSSDVSINLPAAPLALPVLTRQRAANSGVRMDGSRVEMRAGNIGPNGWMDAVIRLPRGSATTGPTAWQQRDAR